MTTTEFVEMCRETWPEAYQIHLSVDGHANWHTDPTVMSRDSTIAYSLTVYHGNFSYSDTAPTLDELADKVRAVKEK